jgi:hypothetical protein
MHPRSRTRRPAAAAFAVPAFIVPALVALALVSTSCTSDSDADDAATATTVARTSDPSTSVVESTTGAPTVPPTTAAPILATFPSPAAAGTALFSVWTSGDRAGAGALNLAPPAELDELFAASPLPDAKNRGCDDGNFDAASCFFGNGQGGVDVGLVPAAGGWSIATIDPFG